MKIKYPKTFHFEFSEGVQNDDRTQRDLSRLVGKEVIVLLKMDGENTSMYADNFHVRSLDSNNHPSRNYVKGIWGKIHYQIPEGWRICGENLFAVHSIEYNDLEDYFMVFSMWNEKNYCLDWDETVDYCKLLELIPVKVLWRGIFDVEKIKEIANNFDTVKNEGFVVRLTESFEYNDFNKCVIKWVRKDHVQTDEHWMNQPIRRNNLKYDK